MNWKKHILRALLALGILILVLATGVSIVVHTEAFNRFVARKIAQKTEESTGAQLSVGKMLIHWGRLQVDFYNLTLRAPAKNEAPLLSCGHLGVRLKILSPWKRRIDLQAIILDHPILRIQVDSNGRTNLPHSAAPSSPGTATNRLFDLAVRRFELNSGQIDYNDQQVPVAAELSDLRAKIQFDSVAQIYEGFLGYDRGRIAAKTLTPFEHAGEMSFIADRTKLSIRSLELSSGGTKLSTQGTVTDYSRPRIQGYYQAAIFTPDLARILKEPSLPYGEIQTSGSLLYDSASNQPFLNAISMAGHMDAPDLMVAMDGAPVRARRLRANYVVQAGELRVQEVTTEVLGGSLNANFSMSDITGARPTCRLNASLRGVSLAELAQIVPSNERKGVRLAGRTNVELQATWNSTPGKAVAHARAAIYGPLTPPVPTDIPVNGFVDVRYDGTSEIATFAPSMVRTANTQVSLNGVLSKRSSLNVDVSARDLHEIAQLISSVGAANPSSKSHSGSFADLGGSANFAGQIAGSPSSPHIHGRLTGSNIVAEGTTWRAIQADVDLSSSGVSLQNASLKGTGSTQLAMNGRVGLQNWSFSLASPVSLQANASGISLTDVQRVAKRQYPIAGTLTTNIAIRGTGKNLAGQASFDISNASAWSEPIHHLAVRLEGDSNSVRVTAQLQLTAGPVSADLKYAPKSQHYEARMEAPKLTLSKIQLPHSRGLKLGGAASISASGKGTISQPQLAATLEIPQLQIEDQTVSQLRTQLSIANQHANVFLNSMVAQGYVQAKGDVDLRGEYFATASIDVRALPIGPLLATYVPKVSSGFEGQTELHGSLSGPLNRPEQIKGQIQIPTLDLAYQSVHLGLADPMKFAYANGVLSIDKADIKGNGAQLSLHGTVPVKSTQPLNLTANGTVDLSLIQVVSPDVKSSGQIDLRLTAQGSMSQPNMQGQIRIANALFSNDTVPVTLEGVNGQIDLAGNRVEIDQLKGTAGGGDISAVGFFVYGQQSAFNISVQGKSVRLRYPEGIRSVLDTNLDLTGTPSSSSLSGRVVVDHLSFTQQFDMANLMGQLSSETPSTSPSPFEQKMKLNVAIVTGQELNATSTKLSVGGSANLTVTGNLADPVILGRTSLTQGEVFFLGKRYEIQNGTIAFPNPVRTEPVLNLYAKTTVQQYNITLNFAGPIDRLRTNYTSDPPLSQSDIINLIAFGQTAEQAATSPSTPASVGAESVLAQGVSGQVSGKIEKLAGISQITIDPLISNSQGDPGSQVAIQQRVSGSLLLTFSTDVTSTQSQTVAVEYRAQKNLRISVIRDQNGGYGIDARIHKAF